MRTGRISLLALLLGALHVAAMAADPTVPPPAIEPVSTEGASPEGRVLNPQVGGHEVITLKNGNVLAGEVLKEKADAIVLDLGFTVISVPVAHIERRTRTTEEGPALPLEGEQPGGLFHEADPRQLREHSVKDLVEVLGESVALVTTPAGVGSGFITDERGYIVTNFHVIQGEQEISVALFRKVDKVLDRVKVDKVKIVAINSFCDLALLKFDVPEGMKVRHVWLGSSDSVRDGQPVFAIGSPLGLERTVSEGIISTTRRNFDGQIFLQTTAPINPGNSGGPLFNMRGEVIGITNMKAGFFTEGLSFAIPVDTLRFFLRNRDVFTFDKDNPNSGYHYLPPPRKPAPADPAAPAAEVH